MGHSIGSPTRSALPVWRNHNCANKEMSILAQGPQTYHRLEEEEGFNNAFRTSDLLLLAGRQDPTAVKPWYRRPAFLWFLGIAMASMVTGAIVWTAVRTSQSEAALVRGRSVRS